MKDKKQTKNNTQSKQNIVNIDGFKMHLSEVSAALNEHENNENDNLINPDDIYNKRLDDL